MAILLMAKNIPVLKIQDGKCEVLCPELLPYNIRKETVSVEDFMETGSMEERYNCQEQTVK